MIILIHHSGVPIWSSSYPSKIVDLAPLSYEHTINAFGGYWTAKIALAVSEPELDDWLESGLGRHVEAFGGGLNKIWEGFVNQISVQMGGLAVTKGPLMQIANSVAIVFTSTDTTTTPPTAGMRFPTPYSSDSDSQALYGVRRIVVSTSGCEDADAYALRDTYLEQNKNPKTSQDFTLLGGSSPTVSLDCLGYVHMLDYPYNAATVGTQDADAKIKAVLAADPNSLFDSANVGTNTLKVKAWEDEDTLALNVIKDVVGRGDASQNRWLFGVYGDREAHYEAASNTEITYLHYLRQPMGIQTVRKQKTDPWDILPGKWLYFPDFLTGRERPGSLWEDPRALFIESVAYTMPQGVRVTGSQLDRYSQQLARLGLGGMGG